MRRTICHLSLALTASLLALALAGCGQSNSVSEKTTPKQVHGDLIVPASAQQPVPKAIAPASPAPAPVVAAVPATTPSPKAVALVSPPTPVAPAPSVTSKPASSAPEYATVGFDKLASYNFEVDDTPATNVTPTTDKANTQIPERVKTLDKTKVSITGFMLPLKVSNGKVTEFLIMKDQSMCCYGTVPKITEWVSVKTPEHGVKSIMDQPVSIEGTLHVGAMRENGYLIGIYSMDGDKLIAPAN